MPDIELLTGEDALLIDDELWEQLIELILAMELPKLLIIKQEVMIIQN